MRIGKFDLDQFCPDTHLQTAVSATLFGGTGFLFGLGGATPLVSFGAATASLGAAWLLRQAATSWKRDNCLLASDLAEIATAQQQPENINDDVTNRLRYVTGNQALTAFESRSAQYKLLIIPNDDPREIAKALPRIASVLGVAPELMEFIPTAGKDNSVIIAPLLEDDWLNVAFRHDQLEAGALKSYLGDDVFGRAVTYKRSSAPHFLVSGTTGSGKTLTIRNDMYSVATSRPDAVIYAIDYKGGINKHCTRFTDDMGKGLDMLNDMIQLARSNWKTVKESGLDNWFEYDAKYPGKLAPLFIYIDEFIQFQTVADAIIDARYQEDKAAARELKDKAPPKPLYTLDLIGELVRVYRAGGCFVTIGTQKPSAELLPTEFRDMFDAKCAHRVPDSAASRVAIDQNGAETLPEKGGFLFQVGSRPLARGRSAYLQTSLK